MFGPVGARALIRRVEVELMPGAVRPAVRPPFYARRFRDGRHGLGEEPPEAPRRLDDDAVLVQRVHVGEEAARLVVVVVCRPERAVRGERARHGAEEGLRQRIVERSDGALLELGRAWFCRAVPQHVVGKAVARVRGSGAAEPPCPPAPARAGRAPRRRPWHSSAPRRRASETPRAARRSSAVHQPFQRFVGRVAARLLQRLGDVSQRCSACSRRQALWRQRLRRSLPAVPMLLGAIAAGVHK